MARTLHKQLSFLPEYRQAKARRLARIDAAYIAGLIDGEGCISAYCHGRSPTVRLEITNTHHPVLEWVHKKTGVGTVGFKQMGPRMRRPCFYWICTARKAADVLMEILPYLHIKRGNAESAIALQAMITAGVRRGRKGLPRGADPIPEQEKVERLRIANHVNDRRYLQ